jgi:hypothetical protein
VDTPITNGRPARATILVLASLMYRISTRTRARFAGGVLFPVGSTAPTCSV